MSWAGRFGEYPYNTEFPPTPARALSDKSDLPLSAWRQDFGVNRDYPYTALMPDIERITVNLVKQRDYICVFDMATEKPDLYTNGLAILHPSSAPIHEIINGEWTLTLTHPIDKEGRWQYIRESNLIKCQGQLFTVKRCEWHYETANTGYVVATCEAMFYQLCDMWVFADSVTVVGYDYCKSAMDGCIEAAVTYDEGAMTRYAFEWDSDWQFSGVWYRTISADGATPVELMLGSGGIIDQMGGELYRDNFYFSINERMEGALDNAFDIRIGINLLGIVRTVDASQLCLWMRLKDTRTGAWGAVSYDGRGRISRLTNRKKNRKNGERRKTMTEIIQAVSTVGFPIACCCFLLWQNSKQDQYHRQQQEELRKTIEGNTKSIEELSGIVKELANMIK